jgi:hypothetical protein
MLGKCLSDWHKLRKIAAGAHRPRAAPLGCGGSCSESEIRRRRTPKWYQNLSSACSSALFGLPGGGCKHRRTDAAVALGVQHFAGIADVARLLVLAELGFADKAGDLDLQPDDRLCHCADKVPGRVTHLPRDRLGRLVPAGQSGDIVTNIALVVADCDCGSSEGARRQAF